MDPQVITKAAKAVLIALTLSGVNISPEHQTAIIEGAVAIYGLVAAAESWLKSRNAKG